MKPIKMTLSAWGPYREEETIDFTSFDKKGLFLITGPTGSGKTTIFDGMTFALYGETSGEMRERESLRSDFSKEGTETYVNFEFSHKGQIYRIERNPKYFRPKKRKTKGGELAEEKERARLFLPDETVVEGPKEVTKAVQKLLALDYRQFKQTTMLAQGEFTRLLYAAPQDKTKIFREIFGTTLYDKFAGELKAKAKELYAEGKSLQDKMDEDIKQISHIPQDEAVWQELVAGESYPYEQIREYLEKEREKTEAFKKEAETASKKAEDCLDKMNKKLQEAKNANAKLLEMEQTREKLLSLRKEEENMKIRQEAVKEARKAGYIESVYHSLLEQKKAEANRKKKEESYLLKQAELKKASADLSFIQEKETFYQHIFLLAEEILKLEQNVSGIEKQKKEEEKKLVYIQAQYEAQEKAVLEKKKQYDEKDRQRKRAAIGLAASFLEEGKPCPVCGSLNHPHIAKPEEGVLSEEELDKLKEDYEKANKELLAIYGQASRNKERVEALGASMEETSARFLEQKEEWKKQIKENEEAVLFLCGEKKPVQPMSWKELYALKKVQENKKRQLEQLKQEFVSVNTLLEEIKKEKEQGKKREKEVEKAWKKALKEQSFESEESFLEKRMAPDMLEKEMDWLNKYEKELHAVTERSKTLEKECKKLEKADISQLLGELEEEKKKRDSILKEKERLAIILDTVKRVTKGLKEKLEKWEQVQKEYGTIKKLENVTTGNNKKRLIFEQYVLAGYFEEILDAANLRLAKMTGNRFLLERVQEAGDGRTKDHLEIAVFDHYTGKSRSVKTLSGGEAFKASLALSLGLSDVIQRSKGGIVVETLFVDEGFGALDSESLDQAVKALYSLVEHNRMIGIISHVPELKERVQEKIMVEKSPNGSRILLEA